MYLVQNSNTVRLSELCLSFCRRNTSLIYCKMSTLTFSLLSVWSRALKLYFFSVNSDHVVHNDQNYFKDYT